MLPVHAVDTSWQTRTTSTYTCKHAKMIAGITGGIAKMEKTLAAENIAPGVTMAFVEQARKTTGTLVDKRQIQCKAATKAGVQQDKLGLSAILRGHHHTEWPDAIFWTYRKQVYPLEIDTKHKRKDKTCP